MVKKIALEEHFMCPGLEDYWKATVADVDPVILGKLTGRLSDFGEQRLASMDAAGIVRAVLSLSGPGVQAERDTGVAVRKAREANDFLAREVQKRRDRYSGFAHLAMQDARAAADELERCVRDLKFCGAMINGHTHGQYLDDPALHPFWERAEALGTVIYLHPRRSGGGAAGAGGTSRAAARHLGVDDRDRLACAAYGVRRPVRSLPESEARARPHGRDASLPALALRQPRSALWRQAREGAVGLHPRQYHRHHVRHVLERAVGLRARRARPRERHVRRRLPSSWRRRLGISSTTRQYRMRFWRISASTARRRCSGFRGTERVGRMAIAPSVVPAKAWIHTPFPQRGGDAVVTIVAKRVMGPRLRAPSRARLWLRFVV